MTLNEFLAQRKNEMLAQISSGQIPSLGSYDQALLRDLQAKGSPQIGTAVLKPGLIVFEFIFSLAEGQTAVFPVEVVPPERIVHLPVPEWVIESVWQGEVQGSFHFESHARELLAKFQEEIHPSNNAKWFERQPPKRRE